MLHGYEGLLFFGAVLGGLFLGAFLLQAACALYNKLSDAVALNTNNPDSEDADRPERVPNLSLGQAVGILFIAAIANGIVGFLIDKFVVGARLLTGGTPWTPSPVASLVLVPLSILTIAAMMPTSFRKGLLIALLYALLWLIVGTLFFVLLFVIGFAYGVLWRMG